MLAAERALTYPYHELALSGTDRCRKLPRLLMPIYERSRMYNAQLAFASGTGFLFDQRPSVVTLSSVAPLRLSPRPGKLGPPPDRWKEMHQPAAFNPSIMGQAREHPTRTFNPSIAHAPHGLCRRCA